MFRESFRRCRDTSTLTNACSQYRHLRAIAMLLNHSRWRIRKLSIKINWTNGDTCRSMRDQRDSVWGDSEPIHHTNSLIVSIATMKWSAFFTKARRCACARGTGIPEAGNSYFILVIGMYHGHGGGFPSICRFPRYSRDKRGWKPWGNAGTDRDRQTVTLSYSIGCSPGFRDGSRETRLVSSRSRGHVRCIRHCDPGTLVV